MLLARQHPKVSRWNVSGTCKERYGRSQAGRPARPTRPASPGNWRAGRGRARWRRSPGGTGRRGSAALVAQALDGAVPARALTARQPGRPAGRRTGCDSGSLERGGKAGEDAAAVMVDGRDLAVHRRRRPRHPAAEMLADRLVAEADSKQRQPRLRAGRDQRQRDAGIVGRPGARRNQDRLGPARQRFGGSQRVVALDPHHRPDLAQIADQIPGEAVIIVDDEDHSRRRLIAPAARRPTAAGARRGSSRRCAGRWRAGHRPQELQLELGARVSCSSCWVGPSACGADAMSPRTLCWATITYQPAPFGPAGPRPRPAASGTRRPEAAAPAGRCA